MHRKDAVELARTDTIDLVRTLVRYKHRAAMRAELNVVESIVVDKFDESVTVGSSFTIDATEILGLLDES